MRFLYTTIFSFYFHQIYCENLDVDLLCINLFLYCLLHKRRLCFLVAFVCLFVCKQHCSNSYEHIAMKFYGGVWGGTIKK